MYIGSTNLFLNLPEYSKFGSPVWIKSESIANRKRKKLFNKNVK